MRRLTKSNTTKPERIFYEILKEHGVRFKHRWIIAGREVDFVIGDVCVEIDGHDQDPEKNNLLAGLGYTPIHFHNSEITRDNITKFIKQIL